MPASQEVDDDSFHSVGRLSKLGLGISKADFEGLAQPMESGECPSIGGLGFRVAGLGVGSPVGLANPLL